MIGPDKDARNKLQLRHPATAESFVEIDYGRQSCALELYLLQLGAKKTSLGVEDFQKTRIAISYAGSQAARFVAVPAPAGLAPPVVRGSFALQSKHLPLL